MSHVFDGNMPSRNNVVIALIAGWVKVLEQYELQGMTSFVKRWNELDNFKDKPIKLLIGNKEVFGIGKGITEQGAVKIETINGIETYIGGEISLRKVE